MLRRAALLCLPLAALGACSPTAGVHNPLVVNPLQYRDDIALNRLQLQVTNGLDEQLPLAAVQLRWAGFNSVVTKFDAVIAVGQRVDLPVEMDAAQCEIDGTTIGPPPDIDDAEAVFTLTDGTTRNADLIDSDDTLGALFAAICQSAMVSQQVTLEFVGVRQSNLDDRPITLATLRLSRRAASGSVTVSSTGNTVPFTLVFPDQAAGEPLVALTSDAIAAEVPVQFLEGRCDAHAVAETKQPFRFVMQVHLGEEPVVAYVVEPPTHVQLDMLATAAAGCATLGADGSLGGSG